MSSYLQQLPNAISIARVLLVFPIIWALLQRNSDLAVILFIVAGVSDGLDGFLAKRFGWQSRLGGILDALADKFLLVSTILCLWWLDVFPGWFVALVFFRDILIVAGATAYNFGVEHIDAAAPSMISKLNTVLQILLVTVAVLGLEIWTVPQMLMDILIGAVVVTVILSGYDYVSVWGKRAIEKGRKHDNIE